MTLGSRPRRATTVAPALLALLIGACEPTSPPSGGETPRTTERSTIRFADVTRASGIDFVHDNGASAHRYLPETMGSGLAFADLDGDDAPDLLLLDGIAVDTALGGEAPDKPFARFYRNRGDGTFVDATAEAGLGTAFLAMGVAVGDVDSDGLPDLFVSGVGDQRLYRNLGRGRFEDDTRRAGLIAPRTPDDVGFGSSAAFFDPDRDGDLDLLVGRYVPWSRETDVECRPDGEHRTYCTPEVYDSAPNRFYRNRGDGTFEDASESSGLADPAGKTLGVTTVDFDRDGWIDVAVANDTDRNQLFRNRGDGTFDEVGVEQGFAFSVSGSTRGAMGIDAGDVDGDGRVDLAVGNFAQEMAAVYRSTDGGLFRDEAAQLGVGLPSLMQVAFGTLLLDLDLDGRLDLVFANGHIEPEIANYQSVQSYRQPLGVYHQRAAGDTVELVRVQAADGPLTETFVGRGLAAADMDGDGDLDLALTQNGGRAVLLRNDSTSADTRRWIRLRAIDAAGSTTPYGLRVEVVTPQRTLERVLRGGSSYLSASEATVTFGLGGLPPEEPIERLELEWTGGARQVLPSPTLNETAVVVEDPTSP